MAKSKWVLMTIAVLFFSWVLLFQVTSPASSFSLGITLTPTLEAPKPTFTVVAAPTRTPVPTLPAPNTTGGGTTGTGGGGAAGGVIIPVTGSDKTTGSDNLINLGLVLLGLGLVSAGFIARKK